MAKHSFKILWYDIKSDHGFGNPIDVWEIFTLVKVSIKNIELASNVA